MESVNLPDQRVSMKSRRIVHVARFLLSVALPSVQAGDVLSANPSWTVRGTGGASTLPIDFHRVTDLAIVRRIGELFSLLEAIG
jgi:hypothetical protein